jgi:nicotinamide-nucleotide amidase
MIDFPATNLNIIRDSLIENQQTLAVAESVTAGLLQTAFSSVENAKDYFHGGMTTYNLGQKAKHLSIDPIHAQHCDCVSEKIAVTMAIHINRLFSSDWGIAITGYASPVPEKNQFDLFAFYSIAFRDQTLIKGRLDADRSDDPLAVRLYYTNKLIEIFKDHVL